MNHRTSAFHSNGMAWLTSLHLGFFLVLFAGCNRDDGTGAAIPGTRAASDILHNNFIKIYGKYKNRIEKFRAMSKKDYDFTDNQNIITECKEYINKIDPTNPPGADPGLSSAVGEVKVKAMAVIVAFETLNKLMFESKNIENDSNTSDNEKQALRQELDQRLETAKQDTLAAVLAQKNVDSKIEDEFNRVKFNSN